MTAVLRGVAHPRGGRADRQDHPIAEAGAWCAPVRTADRLGVGAHVPWCLTQVEAVSAASVPIAAREPRSRPRAEVCAPRSELAGKALSNHLPFDLLILFTLAVHRTRLPLPPDGTRPPLGRACHGHHFLEGAVAGGLLQHVPLPWVWGVGLDAREGGRTRVCLVRRRARERGLQRTPP